jgi:hypothetical protein
MNNHTRTCIVASFVAAVSLASPTHASTFDWALSQLSHGKSSALLTDLAVTVEVKPGWSCQVSAPSGNGGYEARTTTCAKGAERLRFVVQCDADRPKDHVQIQFGGPPVEDYIEVSAHRSGYLCCLTPRSSGRVKDKVPSSDVGVRAAQLNR